MFGFPVVSYPNIASLPRNVSSSSQQIPSEVSDFPIPIAFSRHWGGVTPPHAPRYLRAWELQVKMISAFEKQTDVDHGFFVGPENQKFLCT